MVQIYRPSRISIAATDPAVEPVTLQEMKAHSRVDFSDDDALVSGFIMDARKWFERRAGRALITRTVTYKIDRFPWGREELIELPLGSVQSLTSIDYLDGDGVSTAWAATEYDADLVSVPARVGLAYEKDWPTDIRRWALPITITYVAGYGDGPGDVPEDIRTAIRLYAAQLYEMREGRDVNGSVEIDAIAPKHIAAGYRTRHII